MAEYFPILLFAAIAVAIAIAMSAIPWLVNRPRYGKAKMSAYESGFEAFDTARRTFDVRFYLVAILFIVFDLEVAFLFPWAMVIKEISWFGFWSMMAFLAVLTIGFIYEWKKGALEWE
ncbi:MAG: NADH-quinone oxidoreductase subunit A [Proteobacteria bacterium]|nr:NADH-quinone oxidoreductase subunit A [Pseudomonadota bacterium]